MSEVKAGIGGEHYQPYAERTGGESVVFFTRDLSAEGLKKAYAAIQGNLTGKVAVKLHTGEQNGPNIIPRPWVKSLMEQIPNSTIVETNTYYEGDRYTTAQHRETLKINGWTFCPVDIMDEDGVAALPVKDGKWFTEKNIGIGCADGRIGKAEIHTAVGSDNMWSISEEELMERISESAKATVDYFKDHISFINVMRNMSVSCDCEGVSAAPVVTPNVGILASLDICAVDQASVDLIYAMKEEDHHDLVERIKTRHGLRQLSYMQELGMGNRKYKLIDLDNNQSPLTLQEAVAHVVPFVEPKKVTL